MAARDVLFEQPPNPRPQRTRVRASLSRKPLGGNSQFLDSQV